MLHHNFLAALRQLWRNRLATALNLIGLVIGLGCFVFADGTASWISGRGAEALYKNIYILSEHMTAPGDNEPNNPSTSVLLAPPLRSELPADYRVARLLAPSEGESGVRAGSTKLFMQVYYADPELPRMFPLGSADALTPPHSVMLSAKAAGLLFGTKPAIGQTVSIGGVDATVTAIGKFPASISLFQVNGSDPAMLASWDIFEKLHPNLFITSNPTNWFNFFASTYVAAPAGSGETVAGLDARLDTFGARHVPKGNQQAHFSAAPGYAFLDTMADLGVRSDVTGLTAGTILDLLGTVILIIAVANYINLATAQVLARAREVRIRRILGATAGDLLRQHAIETCLIVAVACLVLAALAVVLLPAAEAQLGDILNLVLADRVFWLHLTTAVLATAVAAGIYPALLFASLPAAGAPRGRRSHSWLRSVLTSLQFASAATLLIFALVAHNENIVMRQVGEPAGVDPVVVIQSDPGTGMASFRDLLRTIPEVRSVSFAAYAPWGAGVSWDLLHKNVPGAPTVNTVINSVGDDYFTTMGIKLLAGRPLSLLRGGDQPPPEGGAIATQEINVVIDRDLATQFGWRNPADAIGQSIDAPDTGTLRVVGVTENRPTNMIVMGIHGNLYWSADNQAKITYVRLDGTHLASGLAAIDAAWNQAAPLAPLKRAFASDLFDAAYRVLSTVTSSISALVIPAFLVALAGLAGMAIEVTRSYLREIAIRKMLGATTWDAARLLLWQFARPLLIANLIAWPLAFAGAEGYLSLFTARVALTLWPFLWGLAGTLAIAGLTVAGETSRTARSSPAEVLRAE